MGDTSAPDAHLSPVEAAAGGGEQPKNGPRIFGGRAAWPSDLERSFDSEILVQGVAATRRKVKWTAGRAGRSMGGPERSRGENGGGGAAGGGRQ